MSQNNTRSITQKAQTRLSGLNATLQANEPPPITFPAFDDLPHVDGQPQGSLWNFFDRPSHGGDGAESVPKDELGTLNLLTPSLVREASQEIQKGLHVQLDWGLDNVQFPGFKRRKFSHRVVDLYSKVGFVSLDDEVHFNTQSGSQWDSLKHFGHQKSRMYYNGLSHEEAMRSERNGIHRWCERGGIVGRGVLVDWVAWYEQVEGVSPPSPVSRHEIPVAELDEVLRFQGTTPRQGDILIVRTGYVRWHDGASEDERKRGTQENAVAIGLQSNETTVRWLYDHHFAAVAGDTVAFEAWPPPLKSGWCLHEWLLTQWGCPVGEMWSLEELSRVCAREGRWTFFLTSAPLNVRGGVGSPPGAIAIL
ncbi:hypothetical protein KC351_g3200 [Hortaea werneckii]|nr:hypothetical protein KC351_g3200 [Hortaea werneckii]